VSDRRPRIRVSIFARLLTIMILMAVTLLVIVGTFFVFFVFPGATAEAAHAFEQFSRGVAATSPDYPAAQALAHRVHVQIRYEGPRGSWSTDSHVPAILDVKQGMAQSFLGHEYHLESAVDGGSYLFVWDYGQHVRDLHAKMLWLLLFLVVGVVCTAYAFQRRLLRPVRLLDDGVGRLSTGDLNVTVPIVTGDEFGALTHTFNNMVQRVKQMIQARDQLLLDVSHELRSPLTRLKVALALLPEDENKAGMAGDLNEMETMITELLELERMREGRGLRR
jgi:signal transduction histidine kinase